jgi:predicted metal-dependent peptidase
MDLDKLINKICEYNEDLVFENNFHDTKNIAYDAALNQHINSKHLPNRVITPDSLSKMLEIEVPENESSEFYYNLIKKEQEKNAGEMKFSIQPGTHKLWGDSIGNKELHSHTTNEMIKKAQNATMKSAGTVPGECSDWLNLHSRKSEVNWKKVLRGIVGNKRVGYRSTIMRNDRRFPNRQDLRGKIKDRKFNLLVIADVSGSMSDDAITSTLAEVRHICDITKTNVDLIQIDTVAYSPEKLCKKTKTVSRKGSGGTMLHPALDMAKKHNIDYQAIVILTDGGLFNDEITHFQKIKKKVIWLIESTGEILDEMNNGRMQAFKLSE